MQERPRSLEGNLRERLIKCVREKGADDPETKRLLTQWTQEEEKAVPVPQPERSKGVILFNIKRARLYAEMGWIEAARDNYSDALMQLGNLEDREFADNTGEVVYEEIDNLRPFN